MADTSPWRNPKPCRIPRDQLDLIDYFPGVDVPKPNLPPRVLEATSEWCRRQQRQQKRHGHTTKSGAEQQNSGTRLCPIQAGQKRTGDRSLPASSPPTRRGEPEQFSQPKDERGNALQLNKGREVEREEEEKEDQDDDDDDDDDEDEDEDDQEDEGTPIPWSISPSRPGHPIPAVQYSEGNMDTWERVATPTPCPKPTPSQSRTPLLPTSRQALYPSTEDSEPDDLALEPPAGVLAPTTEVNISAVQYSLARHPSPSSQMSAPPCGQRPPPTMSSSRPPGPTGTAPRTVDPSQKKYRRMVKAVDEDGVYGPRESHCSTSSASLSQSSNWDSSVPTTPRGTRKRQMQGSPSVSERPRKVQVVEALSAAIISPVEYSDTSRKSPSTAASTSQPDSPNRVSSITATRTKKFVRQLEVAPASERCPMVPPIDDSAPVDDDVESPLESPPTAAFASPPRPRNDASSASCTRKTMHVGQQGQTAPVSEIDVSYDIFRAHYPAYKGDVDCFVLACVDLDLIRATYPLAVHEYVYDTFIHAFYDYREYVAAEESKGVAPKKIVDWFWRTVKEPVGSYGILTWKNLKSVFITHSDKYRRAMDILKAAKNRRSSSDSWGVPTEAELEIVEETTPGERDAENRPVAVLSDHSSRVILATPSQQSCGGREQPATERTPPDCASVVAETPVAIIESAQEGKSSQAKSPGQGISRPTEYVASSSLITTQTLSPKQPNREKILTAEHSSDGRHGSGAWKQVHRSGERQKEQRTPSCTRTPRDQRSLPASSVRPPSVAFSTGLSKDGSWLKGNDFSARRLERHTATDQQTPTRAPARSEGGALATSFSGGLVGKRPSTMPTMADSRPGPNLTPGAAASTERTPHSRSKERQRSTGRGVISSVPLAGLARAGTDHSEAAPNTAWSTSHASTQTTPTPPRALQAAPTVQRPQATPTVQRPQTTPTVQRPQATPTVQRPQSTPTVQRPQSSPSVQKKPQSTPTSQTPQSTPAAQPSAAKAAPRDSLKMVTTGKVVKKGGTIQQRWQKLLKKRQATKRNE